RGRARLLVEGLAPDAAGLSRPSDADPEQLREYLAAAEAVRAADAAAARLVVEAESAGPGGDRYRPLAEQALRARRRAGAAAMEFSSRRLGATEPPASMLIEVDRPIAYLLLTGYGALVLMQTRDSVRSIPVPGLSSGQVESLLTGGTN